LPQAPEGMRDASGMKRGTKPFHNLVWALVD